MLTITYYHVTFICGFNVCSLCMFYKLILSTFFNNIYLKLRHYSIFIWGMSTMPPFPIVHQQNLGLHDAPEFGLRNIALK